MRVENRIKIFEDNTPYEQLKNLYTPKRKIYFIGIGGISMCGLAELAVGQGLVVAGSDMQDFSRRKALEALGIEINIGQVAENIHNFEPDLVVFTLAVHQDNPELVTAKVKGIPVLERSQFLGLINRLHHTVINIAGTNGKSTTTTLCGLIFEASDFDPTIHVGAEIKEYGSTVRAGDFRLMVSEACEFGQSFLKFHSTTAVILNIDHDHVDCYPTLDDVVEVFAQFVANLSAGSTLIYPGFESNVKTMLERVGELKPELLANLRILTFGYDHDSQKPDLCCKKLSFVDGYPVFTLSFQGVDLGEFSLRMPGKYNVDNAMAAMLAALANGCDPEICRGVMRNFTGPGGRYTELGTINQARVIADYAHHPESVKLACQATANFAYERMFTILEPIITSRAELLCDGFVEALKQYQHVLIKEVYDNRELTHAFSAKEIARKINENGGRAQFFADYSELLAYLRNELKPKDICLAMGTLTLHQALSGILD